MLAFAFLSAGIVLGAWWSYDTFGWGGYWGWDPVENAALLPWLTATAYLHSAMVQERRGLLRIWNLSLLLATYALTILGTFLTRSGVVQSVHAFSDSGIGPALIGYFAAVVAVGVGLIGWRGDRLASPGGIDAPVSREGAFLVNNLIFAAIALVVLVGTVFPLFIEALNGQQVSVGRPYFDSFTVPLGIALLFFMAVAPALPWRKASRGVQRRRLARSRPGSGPLTVVVARRRRGPRASRRSSPSGWARSPHPRRFASSSSPALTAHRHGLSAWRGVFGRANGGMIVHIGIVIIAVGLTAASSFAHETELTIAPGKTAHFEGHTLVFRSWVPYANGNEKGREAVIVLDGRTLDPRVGAFDGSSTATSTPAIDSTPFVDVYLSLTSVPSRLNGPVELDVFIQPLIAWLWAVAHWWSSAVSSPRLQVAVVARPTRRLCPCPSSPTSLSARPPGEPCPKTAPPGAVRGSGGRRRRRGDDRGAREPFDRTGDRRRRARSAASPRRRSPGSDLRSGKPVSLQALRGRYVIVNFFASWCQPCETETRPLVAFLFAHRAAIAGERSSAWRSPTPPRTRRPFSREAARTGPR